MVMVKSRQQQEISRIIRELRRQWRKATECEEGGFHVLHNFLNLQLTPLSKAERLRKRIEERRKELQDNVL